MFENILWIFVLDIFLIKFNFLAFKTIILTFDYHLKNKQKNMCVIIIIFFQLWFLFWCILIVHFHGFLSAVDI